MPQARGFFEKLNLVFESTYGTTPTINDGDMVSLPFNSIGIGSSENMIDPETINHAQRFETEPSFGNISVEGPVSVPFDVTNMGYWFKLMFGAPTTTGAGPYEHEFTPSNTNPSATLESGFSDINSYHLFDGIKVNRMSFNFAVDTELTVDMDLLGSSETVGVSTQDNTPVEEVLTRFQAKDIVMKEGGVTVAVATEVSIEVDNGLADDVYALSSNGFRVDLPEQKMMVSGSAKLIFEDQTYYNQAISGDETSIEITATRGTNIVTFLLPEVRFPRTPLERSGHGPVYHTINFKAYFQDSSEGYPIVVTLTNDKASYA